MIASTWHARGAQWHMPTILSPDFTRLASSLRPERLSDPSTRPEGSLPVEILVLSYPVVPPAKA
jgi:hypothetical protein